VGLGALLTPDRVVLLQRAIGNQATRRLLEQPTAPSTPSGVVQRSVGLEIEHNVPIYKAMPWKNPDEAQEVSLRTGSYEYANSKPVYTKGDIVTKVDNNDYSGWLAIQLKENNPKQLPIPAKGISIAEYTTKAPGLDELATGARDTFAEHTRELIGEINANDKGVKGSDYYVGLPPGIPPGPLFGVLGVQATVGVFPSKLDKLHWHAQESGLISGDLRDVHNDVTRIIGVVAPGIARVLRERTETGVGWEQVADDMNLSLEDDDDRQKFHQYRGQLRLVLDETIPSLLRVALSYYLGARRKVPSGQIEKNAVPLLARANLGDVFIKAGIKQWTVSQKIREIFVSVLTEQQGRIREAISEAQKEANTPYQQTPNTEVLRGEGTQDPVDLMIAILNGKKIEHIRPGRSLDKPDKLEIEEKGFDEPVRPETGGTQFEYRTIEAAGWDAKFLEIGQAAFNLNTQHLARQTQEAMARATGWEVDPRLAG
jgi:hypothetical protein